MRLNRPAILFTVALVLSGPGNVWAQAADYSPAAYAYAGALLVNGGLALATGVSLVSGHPKEANGRLALVTGIVTMAVGSGLYVASQGDDLDEQGALVLAGSGLASAALGGLTIWRAKRLAVEATVVPSFDSSARRVLLVLSTRR